MATSSLLVVTGTGTGVGKTHVGCALLYEARRRGVSVVGLKPIESGLSPGAADSDAARLAEAGGGALVAPLFSFGDAVSPHLAARRAGIVIEVDAVVAWVATHAVATQRALVELPGGLLTPLGPRVTCLDALVALEPTWVVVVASDALGALHDVACALGVLAASGFTRVVVALSSPAVADGSSGTNAAELGVVGTTEDAVAFGRGPAASLADPAGVVLDRVGW